MGCPSKHPTLKARDGGPLWCTFLFANHHGPHTSLPPQVDPIEWPRVEGDVPERTDGGFGSGS